MTGIEYMNTVCPTTSKGKEPLREDIVDAFDDGIAEGYRRRWKPSEEQMEILQYVCTQSFHPNPKVIPVLESLYNDLQKLM